MSKSQLTAGTNYKLAELEQFSLPDTEADRASFFEFADSVVRTIKAIELKLLKSTWTVIQGTQLYGKCEVALSGSDVPLENSVLILHTRFSSSQKYRPVFVGAAFVDVLSDPFIYSSGFVGDVKKQCTSFSLQDVVETGVTAFHQSTFRFKDEIKELKKLKLKKHEVLGMGLDFFNHQKMPLTKIKYFIEMVNDLELDRRGVMNGLDVLKAMHPLYEELGVVSKFCLTAHAPQYIRHHLLRKNYE